METLGGLSMSLLKVNFPELYERHLCRHSEYGINAIHLATVVVSYFAIFGILAKLVQPEWWLFLIPIPYFALVGLNVPLRVLAASVAFAGVCLALFVATFITAPWLPIWLYLVLIVLAHQVQNWSHRIYRVEKDMSEFNKKYKKGPALFVLLSLYELPILLNYLVYDRKNWAVAATRTSRLEEVVRSDKKAMEDSSRSAKQALSQSGA
jgi:hypothetical protein